MDADRLTIRKMEVGDLDQVLTLAASSSNPWSEKMFVGEMNHPMAHCYILQPTSLLCPPVLGFICFRNIGDESELLNICVHPQHRQSGLGKKLMQFYLDVCTPSDIKRYYLEVDVTNGPAVRFYQRLSYHPFGIRKKFYEGKYDALLMVKHP